MGAPTDPMAALTGGIDGGMEAYAKLYGKRPDEARTLGSARRTRAQAWLKRVGMIPDVDGRLGDIADGVRTHLMAAWRGEEGWDTEMMVKGVAATKGTKISVNPLDLLSPQGAGDELA